jgi:hypothetical protein
MILGFWKHAWGQLLWRNYCCFGVRNFETLEKVWLKSWEFWNQMAYCNPRNFCPRQNTLQTRLHFYSKNILPIIGKIFLRHCCLWLFIRVCCCFHMEKLKQYFKKIGFIDVVALPQTLVLPFTLFLKIILKISA